MFERLLTLAVVVVVLVAGAFWVVHKYTHRAGVSGFDRARMIAAVARKEPGAAFMSVKCGGAANSGGCTMYVRKGATHRCDGWLATLSPDGQVLLTQVGRKDC